MQFGEGDGQRYDTPLAFLRDYLSNAPKAVDFAERAAGEGDSDDFADDPQALADKARAYQNEQRDRGIVVSTAAAVRHVKGGKS